MCGRFISSTPPAALAEFFQVDETKVEDIPENFNVAPTARVYAVATSSEGDRQLGAFRWGLVPSWAKDPSVGSKMINARAETVATKNAFRRPFLRKRCIVPADGFYEWQRQAAEPGAKPDKQPMYIHSADGTPLAFAGMWEVWKGAGDVEPIRSCTIITTTANDVMAPIHDRMPVILPPSAWETWLDPEVQDPEVLQRLLVPAANDLLVYHPVSKLVNSVKNRGPELIRRIDPSTGELLA